MSDEVKEAQVEVLTAKTKEEMAKEIRDLEFRLHSEENRLEAYRALVIRLAAHLERIEL